MKSFSCSLAVVMVFSIALPLGAQTPPGDLASMSLQDLLAVKIVRKQSTERIDGHPLEGEEYIVEVGEATSFHFSIDYIYVRFDGYLNGDQSLSPQQVLWSSFPAPPRPPDTYPIVPTVIEQQAVNFDVAYDVTDEISLSLQFPYIHQTTHHISAVPGFSNFAISSEGLGDISAGVSWQVWSDEGNTILIGADISFPTGAINETGRTPRSATMDTQLPYTMQLGSGTFDYTPAVAYVGWTDDWMWGAGAEATLRTGRNYRGYRLGNVYEVNAWVRYIQSEWVQPSFRVSTRFWDKIHGDDAALLIPALPNNPYPAPVTDPNAFGGTKILALPGIRLSYPEGDWRGQFLEIEGGVPVYQYLNGPQPKEDWRISVSLSLNF